jgi:repressor LexA
VKTLTPRQHQLLCYIEEFIRIRGYSPSYRELQRYFQFSSVATVYKHLQGLKKKGFLTAEKQQMRSMTLTTPTERSRFSGEVTLPFIGIIRAGVPMEMFTHSKTLAVPEFMVHTLEETFVLQAKGDAFNEERISDNDYLIVEAKTQVSAGHSVIALINGHDTIVKKYYPDGPYVRLIGHDVHQKAILLRPQDVQVQGIIRGLFRVYPP